MLWYNSLNIASNELKLGVWVKSGEVNIIIIIIIICHSYIALMEFCTILVLLPSTVLYKVVRYCCVGILFVVLF